MQIFEAGVKNPHPAAEKGNMMLITCAPSLRSRDRIPESPELRRTSTVARNSRLLLRISSEGGWRKREGIEPPGDIAASRPDLKSGGATSAPSASVGVFASPPMEGGTTCSFPLPSPAISWTSFSSAGGAGSPVSVRSSFSPRVCLIGSRRHYNKKGREER